MGIGQVFSQRSLALKVRTPPTMAKIREGWSWDLGSQPYTCPCGKQLQHKDVGAQNASPTQTDLLLFIIIIYLHYCSISESQLDTSPTLSLSLKAYTLMELSL